MMRNAFGVFVLACSLALAACGNPTSASGSASDSYISVRADGFLELSGTSIAMSADDSVIIRASVIGNPSAYGTPVLSAVDPTVLELRTDGSARVLRPAEIVLSARAVARSTTTRPEILTATGRLSVACTAVLIPGINLRIVDSLTDAAPTGSGAMRIRLSDGVRTDSLITTMPIGGWGGAFERAGIFTATIDADGFFPWRQDGIVVTRGLCHVRTVRVTARLVRR